MFDAVIVGGGHNGLVCACYLAREGLNVAVFERRDILGGACVSEELWPGYKLSTGAYVISLFKEKFIKELKLEEYGLKIYIKDPTIFVPFSKGKYIFNWVNPEKTKKEFEKFSKNDARNYDKWREFWSIFVDFLDFLSLNPPLSLYEIEEIFKFFKKVNLEIKDIEVNEFLRVFLSDAKTILDEYFESEEVKASLVEDAIIGSMLSPSSLGSAYLLAHHIMGEVNGIKGAWGYVKGGMGGLIDALRKAAENLGVKIFTSSEVKRIIVKENKVEGIELENGKIINSKIVVSNADVKTTFLKLLEDVPKKLRKRIELLKSRGVCFKIVGIIEELPDYVGLGKNLGPQHISSTLILPSLDYLEKAYRDAINNKPSKEPFVSINIQSSIDNSVTVKNHHIFSLFVQYTPYRKDWDEIKEDYAKNVIETIQNYAPNFKPLKYFSLSPLDLERRFALPQGCIFHIDMSHDQLYNLRPLPELSNYSTYISGLYLCSSSTHPGGGVSGIPGYNAAMKILEDIKAKRINI